MSDKRDDDSFTGPGPRSSGGGTRRGDGPDIPSGFSATPAGTVRGGSPDIPSGFPQGQPGTVHGGGPDIPSGFGPIPGALGAKLTRGDPLVINSVSYTFERVISKSTGEAEIFLLRSKVGLCVFKLYYPNFKPKEEILAPLKQLRHQDIINILDYGYFHDRFFEIMEYAEGGTLEDYLPIKDLQRLRAIVAETVNAFKFCHARGVVHRDIKPENIYCRNADGTDFVIGDFGISSALDAGMSRRLTSQNLTAGYAAPEMYGFGGKVYIGREVDYYALGITLIHLWQGRSPFDGLTIHAIANLTSAGAINVPSDLPDTLQTLIRGLITIDFTKRWGHGEVQRWLNGEDVPVHFHVKEITYPPFQFDASEKASSPVALARLLKASPDRGKKLLYSGKVSAWINVFDHKLAAELDRIVEDEYPKSQDPGLLKAIYLLDPDEPFTQVNRECRTSQELAAELDDQFAFYVNQLTNPNYSIYLYLEAHEAKKEADAFRAYFRTFSAKKALNTVILELAGRESVTVLGTVFTSAEAVLQARDRTDIVNMLKDRESKLSLWMEVAASQAITTQLEAWRALKISDATTLAYVSAKGDGVPSLEIDPSTCSFSDLKTRDTVSDSFEIRNTGGGTLTGSIKSDKNWLRLAQTQIDGGRKTQTIGFSIDTSGLPFGSTDSAAIEVQSNVGTEIVGITIAIEQGAKAVSRFRNVFAVSMGGVGALLGAIVQAASGLLGQTQPSALAGVAAVLGGTAVAGFAARRNGLAPLMPSGATLACGALAYYLLQKSSAFAFAAASWSACLMVIAYAGAPTVLRVAQSARSKVVAPVFVLSGVVLICGTLLWGSSRLPNWPMEGLTAGKESSPTTASTNSPGTREPPAQLVGTAQCGEWQCLPGKRLRAVKDLVLSGAAPSQLTGVASLQTPSTKKLKRGEWATVEQARYVGWRARGRFVNGQPAEVYYPLGEGCWVVWKNGTAEDSCDVVAESVGKQVSETWLKVVVSGRAFWVPFATEQDPVHDRWIDEGLLNDRVGSAISEYAKARNLNVALVEIDRLLRDGSQINGSGSRHGWTPSWEAGATRDPQLLDALIDRGLNLRDLNVCRSLSSQIMYGMLEKGGLPFLEHAVGRGLDPACLRAPLLSLALLSKDPTSSNYPIDTALGVATYLSARGSSPNEKMEHGKSILETLSEARCTTSPTCSALRSHIQSLPNGTNASPSSSSQASPVSTQLAAVPEGSEPAAKGAGPLPCVRAPANDPEPWKWNEKILASFPAVTTAPEFLGTYAGNREHRLHLWRDAKGVFGELQSPVLEADSPTSRLYKPTFDTNTGALMFSVRLPDGEHNFVGTLRTNAVTGQLRLGQWTTSVEWRREVTGDSAQNPLTASRAKFECFQFLARRN